MSQLTRQMAKGTPPSNLAVHHVDDPADTVLSAVYPRVTRACVPHADYAADGIRSNAVCPGSVATAVLDKYLSDQAEGDPEGRDTDYFLDEISSSHPVGRIANAEEVARFYV